MTKLDIDSAICRLRRPAGEDPRFDAWEKCIENNWELNLTIHRVFKELHFGTFHNIIAADAFLAAATKKQELRKKVPVMEDYRLLWRRINDSMVWMLLGQQRHLVKRLCLYHEHGYLAFQNYDSIVDLLKKLNAPDTSLAIWTDATSCVDVGDVILVDLKKKSFVVAEVKEGKVNEEILNLQFDDRDAVFAFLDKYGEKGAKQVKRMLKQAKTSKEALTLMNTDKGIDPVTGQHMTVADIGIVEETYDDNLNDVLDAAMERGSACARVGNSLWIYAFCGPASARDNHRSFSESVLSNDDGTMRSWLAQCIGQTELLPVVNLREGLKHPATRPLYLRDIRTDHILAIVHHELMVLLFFDWAAFGSDVAALSAEFRWSSRKEGRREKCKPSHERALTVGDYIPQIHKDGMHISLGAPLFLHLLFGGLSPRSYAHLSVGLFELLKRLKKQLTTG